MTKPKHAWMVRAGNNNELADQVEDKHAIAIGWSEMGDISNLETRTQFKARCQERLPDYSPAKVAVNAGQVYRFAREMAEGDYVLTYDKASRELLIGLLVGPCEYVPDVFSGQYPYVRRVDWLKRISRDKFSAPARNSLGSILTVFLLDDHLAEIHSIATAGESTPPGDVVTDVEAPRFYDETQAKADELIADLISRLDPYDFQDLVAGVLQAMGFRAVSSPAGRDGGVDIVAHPDAFGFQRPRIKVQVKHRKGTASGPEMRSFLGTLRDGDSGLYVSTGDFTGDAKREAERSREPVSLLNRDDFIRLLCEHYDALESEYKAQVPLRRLWVPAE
jgi:restriction system protein